MKTTHCISPLCSGCRIDVASLRLAGNRRILYSILRLSYDSYMVASPDIDAIKPVAYNLKCLLWQVFVKIVLQDIVQQHWFSLLGVFGQICRFGGSPVRFAHGMPRTGVPRTA